MPEDTLALDNPNAREFPEAFDAAVKNGGDTMASALYFLNANVNRALIKAWGDRDSLVRGDIVQRLHANRIIDWRHRTVEPTSPWMWADAGSVVHHGLRVGLLREEATESGERCWRLLDKRPHWIMVGTGSRRKEKQIRGLPAAEQAVVDRAEARLLKLRATLDRKYRYKCDEYISRLVTDILAQDPDMRVPKRWAEEKFVPEWLVGRRLDQCASIVREAHHTAELTRETLRDWTDRLDDVVVALGHAVALRQAERAALPERLDLPGDDADALGNLV